MPNPQLPSKYFLAPGIQFFRGLEHNPEPTYNVGIQIYHPFRTRLFRFQLYNASGWGRSPEVVITGHDECEIERGTVSFAGEFVIDNQNFGNPDALGQLLDPNNKYLGSADHKQISGSTIRLWSIPQSGITDFFTQTISTNPLVVANSGARNVKLLNIELSYKLRDLQAVDGRGLPITVLVDGAIVAEINFELLGPSLFLPRIRDAQVPLDRHGTHVDVLSGHLIHDVPLFECEGQGTPASLALYYSSESSLWFRSAARETETDSLTWTPFGQGWGFTFGARVLKPVYRQNLITTDKEYLEYWVQDPYGRVSVFQRSGGPASKIYRVVKDNTVWSDWFRGPADNTTLEKTTDGFLLKVGEYSDAWRFDDEGRLIEIRSHSYGRALQIVWSGTSFTITDSSGREVQFQTDASEKIIRVLDPAGEQWSFRYEGPSLVGVISPEGQLADFAYHQDYFVMIRKTDGRGRTVTYDYNFVNNSANQRRLWGTVIGASSVDADRGIINHTFQYVNSFGNPIDSFECVYTNPNHQSTKYLFDGTTRKRLEITLPGSAVSDRR